MRGSSLSGINPNFLGRKRPVWAPPSCTPDGIRSSRLARRLDKTSDHSPANNDERKFWIHRAELPYRLGMTRVKPALHLPKYTSLRNPEVGLVSTVSKFETTRLVLPGNSDSIEIQRHEAFPPRPQADDRAACFFKGLPLTVRRRPSPKIIGLTTRPVGHVCRYLPAPLVIRKHGLPLRFAGHATEAAMLLSGMFYREIVAAKLTRDGRGENAPRSGKRRRISKTATSGAAKFPRRQIMGKNLEWTIAMLAEFSWTLIWLRRRIFAPHETLIMLCA